MTGPEFAKRWRAQESLLRSEAAVAQRRSRQKIIGMSANNDGPDVQARILYVKRARPRTEAHTNANTYTRQPRAYSSS